MPEPPYQPNQQSSWRYSRHVGNYASPAELPNVAAATVQSPRLFAGSIAFSISDLTLYVCVDATEGAATWTALAAGVPGTDRRTAKLIVGNSLNGDTATDVDFLDPGDGSGIVAALAAIPAGGGDIFIKAGLYDLSLGAVTGPFVIPTGVRVWGAGGLLTTVSGTRIAMRADDVNITAFELGVAANLSDIAITVPPPTVATTAGDGIVEADSRATVERVSVIMDGDSYVTANFAALNAAGAFLVGLNGGGLPEGTSFINCRALNLPRFEEDVTVGVFPGFVAPIDGLLTGEQQLACQLIGCTTDGGDIGVQQTAVGGDPPTTLIVMGHIVKNVSLVGVSLERADRSAIIGCNITIDGVTPGSTRGIRILNTVDETEHVIVEGNFVSTRDAAPAVGSIGIELSGTAPGTVVECTIGNNVIGAQFDTGVSLDADTSRNIVNSNIVHSGAATVVADAGVGNDVAHNI